MAQPGSKGFVRDVLAKLVADILAWLLLGGSVLTGLWAWLRGLTDIEQGVLYANAAWLAVAAGLTAVWRFRKRKQPILGTDTAATSDAAPAGKTQPADTPEPENRARDTLRQILDGPFAECLTSMCRFPVESFPRGAQPEEKCAQLVSGTLSEHHLPAVKQAYGAVEDCFKRGNPLDLAELLLMACTEQYKLTAYAILEAGRFFFNGEFLSDNRYANWHRAQAELVGALRRVQAQKDAGKIALGILSRLPSLPPPEAKRLVDAASVRQLKKIHEQCRAAADTAHDFVRLVICGRVDKEEDGQPPGARTYMVRLLQAHVLQPSQASFNEWTREMQRCESPITPRELALLEDVGSRAIDAYAELLEWIVCAGQVVLGERELQANAGYAGVFDAHKNKCLRTLDSSDLEVAAAWSAKLRRILSYPPRA